MSVTGASAACGAAMVLFSCSVKWGFSKLGALLKGKRGYRGYLGCRGSQIRGTFKGDIWRINRLFRVEGCPKLGVPFWGSP